MKRQESSKSVIRDVAILKLVGMKPIITACVEKKNQ